MALARVIPIATYQALPDGVKEHYKADGDNAVIELTGDDPAFVKLKGEKEAAVAKRKDAEKATATLQTSLDELNEKFAAGEVPKATVDTLKAQLQQKFDKDIKTEKDRTESRDRFIVRTLTQGAAKAIASEISTVPGIMAKEVASRLTVTFDGDEPALVVLDKDGKPTAFTTEDLQKEYVDNPEFAAIITGSKASGSGATGKGRGGAGGTQTKKFNELTDAERNDFLKRDPAGFKAAADAAKAEVWGAPR